MNIRTRTRRITRTFGVTLVAGGLVLAGTVSAQAAQTWELVGGKAIKMTWNVGSGVTNTACVGPGSRHSINSSIKTVVYSMADGCIEGAGVQCKTFTPSSPASGWWRFDATTCKWTNLVTESA